MAKKATTTAGTPAKGSRSAAGVRVQPASRPAAATAGGSTASQSLRRDPLRIFEEAISLFHARDFAAAKGLFLQAAEEAPPAVRHSAKLHARICDQQIARQAPVLENAEDCYDYAVALINQRRLDEADKHLQRALSEKPDGDHILYAVALCAALRGDLATAHQNLKRAIEIQPRNRTTAQNDPDFAGLARVPPLRELVFPPMGPVRH